MKHFITTIMLSLIIVLSWAQNENFEYFPSFHHNLKGTMQSVDPLLDKYDVKYYWLDLNISLSSAVISGNVLVAGIALTDIDTFAIELGNSLTVDSIHYNGTIQSFTHASNMVTLLPDTIIPTDGWMEARIFYHGTPSDGYFVGSQWGSPVTAFSLSEPYYALNWFPCKQDLEDKIDSVSFYITVDNGVLAGSNGLLVGVDTLAQNKLKYRWESRYPIDYYLISLAASTYEEYSFDVQIPGIAEPVLVQNYVWSLSASNLEDIDLIGEQLILFSELFGVYPFADEKYGHCQCPIGGGMEHQTMTSCGYFAAWLIAHEGAHMWFGNHVTCASWQDLWINEGFASYAEYLAKEMLEGQPEADAWMEEAHYQAMTEPDGSVYVPLNDILDDNRLFSFALTYRKGGSLLHMIRFELDNDSLFFSILKEYLVQYGGSSATGEDFKNVLEAESGMDFGIFFDQWYYGKGFPSFELEVSQQDSLLSFNSIQTPSSVETPLFVTPMEYRITYASGGDTIIRVMHYENIETYSLVVPEVVSGIEIDPNNWVINGDGGFLWLTNGAVQIQQSLVNLYPNPFSKSLNLIFTEPGKKQIVICDALGHKVDSFETSETNYSMNTCNWEEGIYIISVCSEKGNSVRKMVHVRN